MVDESMYCDKCGSIMEWLEECDYCGEMFCHYCGDQENSCCDDCDGSYEDYSEW